MIKRKKEIKIGDRIKNKKCKRKEIKRGKE